MAALDIESAVQLQQFRQHLERTRYAAYADDPESYARDVLGVTWWAKQIEIAQALMEHKRVLARASHGVGKTHMAGGLVNWFYDTRIPGITLTTAPTARQVVRLLWSEVRSQRRGRPGLLPKAPRMESDAKHYAEGYTASDSESFQGAHEESLFIVFDEGTGIDGPFWDGADGMLTSGEDNLFLAIYNPTDPTSKAYEKEQSDAYHLVTISALEHPNIIAELAGRPAPYPKAVRLSWLLERIDEWCVPISAGDTDVTDVEFPPGSGIWYRPGAEFESRVLARWPSSASTAVWSEAAFTVICDASRRQPEPQDVPCEIGCDVARHGDDDTAIHVRRGPVSLVHEWHNGWETTRTAGRLIELARQYGERAGVDGRSVAIKVDDSGVGGGVTDMLKEDRWNVVPITAAAAAIEKERYPNRRSELWFSVAGRAKAGDLDLSRLDAGAIKRLRIQCMAPRWALNSRGQRVVEPKPDTKKRVGRSPDDADAMNLAYAVGPSFAGWQSARIVG